MIGAGLMFCSFFVILSIVMQTFLVILLVTLVIVAICFVAIGVQVFWGRKKKFPDTEIGRNAEMRKRNIKCAKCEELERCALSEKVCEKCE